MPVVQRWRRTTGILLLLLATVAASCSDATDAASPTFETKKDGKLVVATDLPVTGFWDGSDPSTVSAGFEWGLATAIADWLDLELEVVDVPFPRIVQGDLGSADIAIAQISITRERRDQVDFSVPYSTSWPTVVTRRDEQDDLVDLATARDQRWAVERATTEHELVEDVIRSEEESVLSDDESGAVRLVATGRADAALVDLPTALMLTGQDDRVVVRSRFDREEHYGIALPKGSDNTHVVNQAIRSLRADETIEQLMARWLEPRFSTDPSSVPVIRFSDS